MMRCRCKTMLFFLSGMSVLAGAGTVVPAALPPAVHADTETVTNVPFATALDAAGRLSFDLACRATPSNNVEVAFGTDANGDGAVNTEDAEYILDIYAKTAAVSDNEENIADNTTEEAE